MRTVIKLTSEQALYKALNYAEIGNDEYDCLSKEYRDGLYFFLVQTAYLKYEFFVDAACGAVLGINTEPVVL